MGINESYFLIRMSMKPKFLVIYFRANKSCC